MARLVAARAPRRGASGRWLRYSLIGLMACYVIVSRRASDGVFSQEQAGGGGGASSSSGADESGAARVEPAKARSSAQTAEGPARVKTVCEDSCPGRAKDNVCDEGRPGPGADPSSIHTVRCDLGTDCSDCGPWVHNNTDASDGWKPIAEIKGKGFEVLARQAATQPPFWIAFTNPEKDLDVSVNLHQRGLVEPGYAWVWSSILKEGCRGPGGERRLALDVGANFGFYSLMSAAHGCRVIAWEPVPYFSAYAKWALLRNNLTHLVELRSSIVSNVSGGELSIEVPKRGIWGTASIGGANIDRAIDNEGDYDKITRPVERLDEQVAEDVLIMKVDVEGFEPHVLRSARGLLLHHRVEHIVFEYSPGVAEAHLDWQWYEDNPKILAGLLNGGYTLLHMAQIGHDVKPDWTAKQPLPAMGQVTKELVELDIQDARLLQNRTLGCHPDTPELAPFEPFAVFHCNTIPEALDPRSFRASFGFNTNILAFLKKRWFATVGPPAALVPMSFDIQHKYFVPDGKIGPGYHLCRDAEIKKQVWQRCPCTDRAVCGEVEAVVRQVAADGRLPPFPWAGEPVRLDEMTIGRW